RGLKTRYTDGQLVGEIRRTIQASPFHGEGHRKVWARLRLAGVRTSLRRVLRLMRQHELLTLRRQPQPVAAKRHEGRIKAGRPNPMWGIDAPAGFTLPDGQILIFAMINHGSACCVGMHVARRGRGSRRSSRCARPCVSGQAVSAGASPWASSCVMTKAPKS
ncbi:MAG: IS3 family transposase, partial [Anaerolineales bacterium]|nr:IS3 family transposase [Anaerolineales bacterium]